MEGTVNNYDLVQIAGATRLAIWFGPVTGKIKRTDWPDYVGYFPPNPLTRYRRWL